MSCVLVVDQWYVVNAHVQGLCWCPNCRNSSINNVIFYNDNMATAGHNKHMHANKSKLLYSIVFLIVPISSISHSTTSPLCGTVCMRCGMSTGKRTRTMYTVFTHTCTFHYHTQLPWQWSLNMLLIFKHVLEDCPNGHHPLPKFSVFVSLARPFPSTMRTLQLYSNVEAFPQQTWTGECTV